MYRVYVWAYITGSMAFANARQQMTCAKPTRTCRQNTAQYLALLCILTCCKTTTYNNGTFCA